jgi:sulfofructose kinase
MTSCPLVDVVGVGLNATDTLIRVPAFPAPGGKLEYSAETLQLGGQVASAMIACQSWGLRTRYVGRLGDDHAADLHEHAFHRAGVEAHTVRVAGAGSPRSLILLDPEGERSVLCRRDDRLTLQAEDLRREWITRARVLLVDGHDTAAATLAAQWARDAGIPVVADLDAPYPGLEELLNHIDYLIVSRDLPEQLTDDGDLPRSLRSLHAQYGFRLTAATLGAEGVLAWDGARFHQAAAFQVPVLDTTGAGDLFHAGFLYGLLQGWPLPQQLEFANAAAALNCTAEGARGGIHPVTEIQELIRSGVRMSYKENATI